MLIVHPNKKSLINLNYYSYINMCDVNTTHFEASMRAALAVTDKYVWLYSENPVWWGNQNLNPQYVTALANTKQP